MKLSRVFLAAALILSMVSGCGREEPQKGDTILATTYPMYYLTSRLTEGMEDVTVELMISDSVSCLHDYTLTTAQMRKIDRADLVVMNGGGLEDFMASALESVPEENIIAPGDTMETPIGWLDPKEDPHYWLNPVWYGGAAEIVRDALAERYPEQYKLLDFNYRYFWEELCDLRDEMTGLWEGLSCREMITFHDGFAWFAKHMQIEILAAIEEEEGAEASAKEIVEISQLVREHDIPAIFTEVNGSDATANAIGRETGCQVWMLDMLMSGDDVPQDWGLEKIMEQYISRLKGDLETVREALG